jgi:hypothetical protein
MKSQKIGVVILVMLYFPNVVLAGSNESANPTHKYWVCAISSYYSQIDGKREDGKCRANTEYSEPQCREFVVEYEGEGGVRPGVPYKEISNGHRQDSLSNVPNDLENQTNSTTTKIAITKENNHYSYAHIIENTTIKSTNQWVYTGKCNYFEAPLSEKIYLQRGLNAETK